MKIRALRMVEVDFDSEDIGICWSFSRDSIYNVKASNLMCAVGMVRRGRSWGYYGGQYCCECPYFIHEKVMGEWEKRLMEDLKDLISRN